MTDPETTSVYVPDKDAVRSNLIETITEVVRDEPDASPEYLVGALLEHVVDSLLEWGNGLAKQAEQFRATAGNLQKLLDERDRQLAELNGKLGERGDTIFEQAQELANAKRVTDRLAAKYEEARNSLHSLSLNFDEVREAVDLPDATPELVVHKVQEMARKVLTLDHPERPPWTPIDPWVEEGPSSSVRETGPWIPKPGEQVRVSYDTGGCNVSTVQEDGRYVGYEAVRYGRARVGLASGVRDTEETVGCACCFAAHPETGFKRGQCISSESEPEGCGHSFKEHLINPARSSGEAGEAGQ